VIIKYNVQLFETELEGFACIDALNLIPLPIYTEE
jgi:hypothetical protein